MYAGVQQRDASLVAHVLLSLPTFFSPCLPSSPPQHAIPDCSLLLAACACHPAAQGAHGAGRWSRRELHSKKQGQEQGVAKEEMY